MYVLLLIVISSKTIITTPVGTYETMYECFDARDDVLVDLRAYDGVMPAGKQAVCIPISNDMNGKKEELL